MISSSLPIPAPPVQVLLATYNGARFLREQIDSILAQTYPNLTILARDDGSSDQTQPILDEYAARFPDRFHQPPPTPPTGSAKLNFRTLIRAASAPYLACADQDDVWLPTKIDHSMQAMLQLEQAHTASLPLLVFTDLAVVDEKLNLVQPSLRRFQNILPEKIHDFRRLLTQNVVTGCTTLFNRPLAERAARMPDKVYMHDWWIALIACAFGSATYLPQQTVLYRQHAANLLGAVGHGGNRTIPSWRFHIRRREQWEASEQQAEAMLESFGPELPEHVRQLLTAYIRCETSPSRIVRVFTLIRNRFFLNDLRPNLAILWYLWDMEAAKRGDLPSSSR